MALTLCDMGHIHVSLLVDERTPATVRGEIGPALSEGYSPEAVIAGIEYVMYAQRRIGRSMRRGWLNRWVKGEEGP